MQSKASEEKVMSEKITTSAKKSRSGQPSRRKSHLQCVCKEMEIKSYCM